MKHGSGVEAERLGTDRSKPSNDKKSDQVFAAALKRGMDVVLATLVFFFAAPIILIAGLLVKHADGGPMFYSQRRCGRNGVMFDCLKIRTMYIDADQRLQDLLKSDETLAAKWKSHRKLENDPRVTPIGKFLRKSSIDELPQLINIIRGDMSVIGPRPVTFEETNLYGDKVIYYKAVRPGVLGLWQVKGRNRLNYEQRVAYDVQYVRDWSLWMDIKILLLAVPVVLLGRGAY